MNRVHTRICKFRNIAGIFSIIYRQLELYYNIHIPSVRLYRSVIPQSVCMVSETPPASI